MSQTSQARRAAPPQEIDELRARLDVLAIVEVLRIVESGGEPAIYHRLVTDDTITLYAALDLLNMLFSFLDHIAEGGDRDHIASFRETVEARLVKISDDS